MDFGLTADGFVNLSDPSDHSIQRWIQHEKEELFKSRASARIVVPGPSPQAGQQ